MARNDDARKRDDSLHNGSPAERVLAHAQAGREIVQDFVALAESLEWNLGQEYLRQRGNKAFLSDTSPVPFVVNNDGTLSRNAADVFFQSLLTAEQDGTLEPDIFVLELGIGVGLFARFFLGRLRELSRQHKKDYERVTYIAADRSERMLNDVLRHGVLAEHPGRYCVRRIDAMEPEILLQDVPLRGTRGNGQGASQTLSLPTPLPQGERGAGRGRLRAVFLNYLLDCLPAAALEWDGVRTRQLCVRTCVARNVRLADYTDLTAEQLRQRAERLRPPHLQPLSPEGARGEKEARDDLLEVYGLFASEYEYQPVDPQTLPHGTFAVEYGRTRTKRLLHSYGAIQCLDKLLGMVADGGFILVNDYGQTALGRDDEFEHQRFSLATFVGVNFALLKAYYERRQTSEVSKTSEVCYLEPAAVMFGSNAATNVSVNSAGTQITATAPAGAAGTVKVTVTTPGGIALSKVARLFTYVALPAVTGISPATGPQAGGTTVTITGINLTGATTVKFGTKTATRLQVISATRITVTAPSGVGVVDVTVTTNTGTSATSSADKYTYSLP